MRILVVEDEPRIANSIKLGLQQERYAVDLASDGELGLDLALSENYDLILLDLMLPKLDGLSLSRKLRSSGNHTPILMLTAKGDLQDKVTGLDSGADDYLVKPFAFEELLARIRALTRRPQKALPTVLTYADLSLDTLGFTLKRGKRDLLLSKKEFSLLEYFLRHQETIITKQALISHVWDYDADILDNTVEVNIKNLRRKLGKPELIKTVRGFGYKLELK